MKKALRGCARLSLVAGVVLLGFLPRESMRGVLYYQKPILATLACPFYSLRLQKQAFDAPGNKKPGALSYTGLLVVDYTIEISNLELVKDLKEVVVLQELLNIS